MIKFKSFFSTSTKAIDTQINKWLEENPRITILPSHQQSFLESPTLSKESLVYFVSFLYDEHPFTQNLQTDLLEAPFTQNLQTDLLEAAINLEEVRQFLIRASHGGLSIERKVRALGYSDLEDLETHYFALADVTYSRTPELNKDIGSLFKGRVLRSLERNRFIKLGQLRNLSERDLFALTSFGSVRIKMMKDQIVENHLEWLFPNLFY